MFMHQPFDIKCMMHIRQAGTVCRMSFVSRCLCLKIFFIALAIKRLSVRDGRQTIFQARLQKTAVTTQMNALSLRGTGTHFSLHTAELRFCLQEQKPVRLQRMFMMKQQLWRNMVLLRRHLFRLRHCRVIQAIIFPELQALVQKPHWI